MSAVLQSHLLWYLNRGTGIVLVALLTLTTALGVLSASGRQSGRWPRFAQQTLHRNVSLIACGLLVAHALTPVADAYVHHYAPVTWLDTVVPFVSAYKTFALGLGTLALDLVAVVVVSSLARHRFGHRAWYRLHLFTYVAWGLGALHGFLIGTDSRTVWGLGVLAAGVVVVAGAVVVRLGARTFEPRFADEPPDAGWSDPGPAPETRRGRRAAGRRAA